MPKIPVTETSIGFQPATMPTISGESYAAPGNALKQVGGALGEFGAAISAQDEFGDKLASANFLNDETMRQMKANTEDLPTRENPDGYATQMHGGRTERFNQFYNTLKTEGGRRQAQMMWANQGHNFYEKDQHLEYGVRENKLVGNLSTALAKVGSVDDGMNDADVEGSIQKKIAAGSAMINQAPVSEAHKERMRSLLGEQIVKAFTEWSTKQGKTDGYDIIKKSVEKWIGDPVNQVPQEGQGQPQAGGKLFPVPGVDPNSVPRSGGAPNSREHMGPRGGGSHAGWDIPLKVGQPVVAVGNGVVIAKGSGQGYGEYVDVRYDDGTIHRMAHLGDQSKGGAQKAFADGLQVGSQVKAGQEIGYGGFSGNAGREFTHVHYEIFPDKSAYDKSSQGSSRATANLRINPRDYFTGASAPSGGGSVPVAQRGITSYAGMGQGGLTPKVTAYSPQADSPLKGMEGGYAASKPGPDGKAEVRTLEDVAAGRSKYITVAGDPSQYGKEFTIPRIEWIDSQGKRQVSENVTAVVHDTGGAFKGAGDKKFDIPVARDMTNAQMNSQPFLKGGVQFMPKGAAQTQTAGQGGGPIWSSLQQPPSAQEVMDAKAKGVKTIGFDFGQPGASQAVAAAKAAGMKVEAYHEGPGGGPTWGERSIGAKMLTDKNERAQFATQVKALAQAGADLLHVDNVDSYTPAQLRELSALVKEASDGKVKLVAKNAPGKFAEAIKSDPTMKDEIAHAVVEHGASKPEENAGARALQATGVPVYLKEFGIARPGSGGTAMSREDAQKFARENPQFEGVLHSPNENQYGGTQGNRAQFYGRDAGTIPGAPQQPRPMQIAAGGDRTMGVVMHMLADKLPVLAAAQQAAQEKWAKDIAGDLKKMRDAADQGYMPDQATSDRIMQALQSKPDLVAKYNLHGEAQLTMAHLQERQAMIGLTPVQLDAIAKARRDQMQRTGTNDTELIKRQAALEKFAAEAREQVNKDPISWADRTGTMKAQPIDWAKPESLADRASLARTLADRYQQPVQMFTKAERDALKDDFAKGGQELVKKLGMLATALGNGPDMLQVMTEVAGKAEAPVAANIGAMLATGYGIKTIEDAAEGMARVHKRAMGEKIDVPVKHDDERKLLIEAIGNVGARMPMTEATILDTARAIYEVRAHRQGLTKADNDLFKSIIKEVAGENTDKSGMKYGGVYFQSGLLSGSNPIIMPPHIRQDALPQIADAIYSVDDLKPTYAPTEATDYATGEKFASQKQIGVPSMVLGKENPDIYKGPVQTGPAYAGPVDVQGRPMTTATLRKAIPVQVGYGRFKLAQGDPTSGDPMFVKDSGTGKDYVLDIIQLEPLLKQRRPDLYKGFVPPESGGPALPAQAKRPRDASGMPGATNALNNIQTMIGNKYDNGVWPGQQ